VDHNNVRCNNDFWRKNLLDGCQSCKSTLLKKIPSYHKVGFAKCKLSYGVED
jgi:hypothetical protein